MEKVEVLGTERWERLYPEKRGADVRITFTDGQVLSAEVDLPKGEPENPATPEEVRAKFMTNAGRLVAFDAAEALYETVMDLENRSLKDFVRLLWVEFYLMSKTEKGAKHVLRIPEA